MDARRKIIAASRDKPVPAAEADPSEKFADPILAALGEISSIRAKLYRGGEKVLFREIKDVENRLSDLKLLIESRSALDKERDHYTELEIIREKAAALKKSIEGNRKEEVEGSISEIVRLHDRIRKRLIK